MLSNIISAALTGKMIRKRCEAYLAYVVDTQVGSPALRDIPTVCNFLDVFPNELLGLPPEREVQFEIDVMPVWTQSQLLYIEWHLLN